MPRTILREGGIYYDFVKTAAPCAEYAAATIARLARPRRYDVVPFAATFVKMA